MNRSGGSRFLQLVVTAALLYGITVACGGGLWAVAGAGIYGSPFSELESMQAMSYLAFLLVGPLAALVGGVLALFSPRHAVLWLFVFGLCTSPFALSWMTTDAGVFPVLLVTLPMVTISILLNRAVQSGVKLAYAREIPSTEIARVVESPASATLERRQVISIMIGVGLFLGSFVAMFLLNTYCVMENVFGYRTVPPVFGLDQEKLPDTYVVLTFLLPTLFLPLLARQVRWRWEWLVGLWTAQLLGLLIIWLR